MFKVNNKETRTTQLGLLFLVAILVVIVNSALLLMLLHYNRIRRREVFQVNFAKFFKILEHFLTSATVNTFFLEFFEVFRIVF